jgi:hypothetical protein
LFTKLLCHDVIRFAEKVRQHLRTLHHGDVTKPHAARVPHDIYFEGGVCPGQVGNVIAERDRQIPVGLRGNNFGLLHSAHIKHRDIIIEQKTGACGELRLLLTPFAYLILLEERNRVIEK